MAQKMDTLMNEMDPRCFALVVESLKTTDKSLEGYVTVTKVLRSNSGTLERLNPSNQFAVILPVRLWKYVSQ